MAKEKKRVNFINKHDWMSVRMLFDGIPKRINLTYSWNGVKVSFPEEAGRDFVKRMAAAASKIYKSGKGNLKERMESIAALAEKNAKLEDFVKELETLAN